MAEKKLKYREVPQALGFVLRTIWQISPVYIILMFTRQIKDRLVPYATLFIAAAITSRLPDVVNGAAVRPVILLSALALGIELVSRLFDVAFTKVVVRAEARVAVVMREQFYKKFASLPYHLYEDKDVLDAFNYADEFMYRFSQFGLYSIARSIGAVIEFIVATFALLAVAWYMPLLLLAVMPFLVRAVFRINREAARVQKYKQPDQRRIWTIERMFYPRGIKETRLYGVVDHFLAQRSKLAVAINEREQKVQFKREHLNFVQESEVQLASFAASVVAVWRIATQGAPLGIFLLAQQLTSRAGGAIDSLFSELSQFDADLYGFSEFRYITEDLQPKVDPEKLAKIASQPDIELKNISFTYPDAPTAALKNVSLKIPYGSTLAIVGENGAGKTTLTKLILGLYRPEKGSLWVGGQDLAESDEASWLARIGVLLQDFGMNEDITMREAVRIGDITRAESDELIWQALEQAELKGVIEKLPHKLDSYLGKWVDEDKGTELSGGQLQRLAIARTLYRDPEVLILDEPTSAIDANAEERIFNRLQAARKGKTTIFISHRFSTVRRAKQIVFIHEGRISETGTHEQLMKMKGKYYEMFTKQAEGYR